MGKRFKLAKDQKINIPVPQKFQSRFGTYLKSGPVATRSDVSVNIEKKRSKRKKKNSRKIKNKLPDFNSFIRAVAFVVMFSSLAVLCKYASGYVEDVELNESIIDEYGIVFHPSDESIYDDIDRDVPIYPIEDTDDGENSRFTYPVMSSLDGIKNLSATYEDFVFWMYIENTSINYPVVQCEDNEYYLRRNIKGEDNLSGTLFLDYRNESDMSYGNNIVYGHNMQNGTMFGSLKKYEKKSYFDSHSMIYTYTETEVTAWKIFSVYETTTDNYYIQTDFINKDNYFEFIKGLQSASIHKSDVVLTEDTSIMTLSTCHKYDYENGRLVVHAAQVFTAAIS